MADANKQKTLAAVKKAAGKRFAKVQKMADTLWKPQYAERNALFDALLRYAAGLASQAPKVDELRYEIDWVFSLVSDDRRRGTIGTSASCWRSRRRRRAVNV